MNQPKKRIRNTSRELQLAARNLRKVQTTAEATLWDALRGKKLDGLKFRRQHPMGRFIADFYCSECQLVIEVDGSSHEGQEHRDAARTEVMEQFGCRLVRFSNEEVLDDLSGVLKQIRTVCGEA